MNPEDLLYAETHEWVHVADGVATIGISSFAAEQLTDLVYMELPDVGRTLKAGEEMGEVESVKAVSPIYSPVDGEVTEVNAEVPDDLEQLANDAMKAWLVKIKLSDEGALGKLLDHGAYEKQCAEGG